MTQSPASIALPLRDGPRVFGVITIYDTEADTFDKVGKDDLAFNAAVLSLATAVFMMGMLALRLVTVWWFGQGFTKKRVMVLGDGPSAESVINYIKSAAGSHLRYIETPQRQPSNVTSISGNLAIKPATEMAMTLSEAAKVGLPEVKLGIYPGFGGTFRLPRVIGCDNAIEWIASGKEQRPADALKVGAVDAVVKPALLQSAALDLVKRAISGELDFKVLLREF